MNIHPKTKEAYQLFHDGILALGRAEQLGMRVDVDYCIRKKEYLTKKIKRIQTRLMDSEFVKEWKMHFGMKFNMNSNDQLATFLYDVKKLAPIKMTTGGKEGKKKKGSTDIESLSQLNIPELNRILEIGKLMKIRDTYLDGFLREQVDGRIHTFLNLHLVKTFRSSCDHPNLQNIPVREEEAMKICRGAIFARVGNQLLDVDYKGIEVSIAGCYTQDERLIYDVIHGDMHKDMAIECYMLDSLDKSHPGEGALRFGGKSGFVFPEFYGDYYGQCAPNLLKFAKGVTLKNDTPAWVHLQDKGLIRLDKNGELRNYDKFIEHIKHIEDDFWNVRYKTYTKWKDKTWKKYQKDGYIDTLTGFRCGGVMTRNKILNAPIQGTAFHCLLWSFIQIDRIAQEENWNSRPILQVHDDIIIDTDPIELEYVAKTIKRITCKDLVEKWKWITVPMEIEAELCGIDSPWSEKKGYEIAA